MKHAAAYLTSLCFIACGDDTSRSNNTFDVPEVLFGDITRFDVTEVDSSLFPDGSLPEDFGDACLENTDCSSGYCIEGPSGSVCTRTCVDACPDGWDCRAVQIAGADIVLLCVPTGEEPADTSVTQDTSAPSDTDEDIQIQTDVATSGDTTQTDTSLPPLTGNACEHDYGIGDDTLYDEASASAGPDFPDCIGLCDHAAQTGLWEIDLRSSGYTGAIGYIDDDDHEYQSGFGPDREVIAIRAYPRTMIEFAVQKVTAGGRMDPVVYVSDQVNIQTYNSDVTPTNLCARTTIAYPYTGDVPIFVVIDDAVNYALERPDGSFEGGTVGGPDYGYTLRIRTGEFDPVELGNVAPGATLNSNGHELVLGGETRYFRFYAPGASASGTTTRPRVTVRRASGAAADFTIALAGMKTLKGELESTGVRYDSNDTGAVTLNASPSGANAFRACTPQAECPDGFPCVQPECTTAPVEYIFAVMDYNGAADPGAFRYDVTVTLP